ncbi:MAG: acyl-CoA dehydrogenase family protein [Burkholderiales bacterium]|nr:acyl-CoA dehydrogenase family protein [Burkholderiales bacterium]
MEFEIAPDDAALAGEVRRYARKVMAARAARIDESGAFPGDNVRELAAMGVLGVNIPSEYGGVGASPFGIAGVMEAMTIGCAATAAAVGAHYLATDAVLIGGNDEQKRRLLPRAARGEILGAYALTEPRSGSDPAGMLTRATLEGGGFRIRGTKHFITNGAEADFIVTFARSGNEPGSKGVSAFIVETAAGGVSASAPEPVMGIRGSRIYELAFDCLVPETNLLGELGRGFKIAMAVLDRGRVDVAAMGVGLGEVALDAAIAWSKERAAFSHKIGEYQGIQWMLADMAVSLEAARLLTSKAAWARGKGGRFTKEAAMAKLFASEAAGKITDLALQIHGGFGYTRGLPLERYVRDARILRIFEGSSEIQRNVIARHLLAD